jgi:hypothetical protein
MVGPISSDLIRFSPFANKNAGSSQDVTSAAAGVLATSDRPPPPSVLGRELDLHSRVERLGGRIRSVPGRVLDREGGERQIILSRRIVKKRDYIMRAR